MPVTPATVQDVGTLLGLRLDRFEGTRPTAADSAGNGNWQLWTTDGERHILQRYHVLRTVADIAECNLLDLPRAIVHWHR
jgi:hypothetical protein